MRVFNHSQQAGIAQRLLVQELEEVTESKEAVGVTRCLDTLGYKEVADVVVGNVFLVRQFWIFVNL